MKIFYIMQKFNPLILQGNCADKKGPAFQSVREGGSFLRLSVGRIKTKYFYGASFVPFSAL